MDNRDAEMNRDIGFIEGRMVDVVGDLEKVTEVLVGNSKPGLITLQSNMEKDIHRVLIAVESMETKLDGLCTVVDAHTKDKEVHSWRMLLRKDILTTILVIFLVLNALVSNTGTALAYLLAWFGL